MGPNQIRTRRSLGFLPPQVIFSVLIKKKLSSLFILCPRSRRRRARRRPRDTTPSRAANHEGCCAVAEAPSADLDVLEAGFRCGGIGGLGHGACRSPRRHGLRITTPAAWDRRHRPAPSRARGRCGACQTTSGICIDNSANRHNSSSLSLNHTKIMRVV